MNVIANKIKESIDKVNYYLLSIDSIQIGSESIDLTSIPGRERPKVTDYFNAENKHDYLFNECLQKYFKEEIRYNRSEDMHDEILKSCSFYCNMITDKMIGPQ